VHIVTRKHLREAIEQYPDAANEIKAWVGIVEAVRWHSFLEVCSMFKDADFVNGYVVFNIRRNRYRLITVIHYAKNGGWKADGRTCLHPILSDAQAVQRSRQLGQKVRHTMSTVLANPAEMIAHGAPHVIHNDEELEAYTEALFRLTALENPSPSELEAIELLTLLVERYEQTHYSIPTADAVSVVRFLIEQQNLTQRDLIPEFGSESAVSMFLAGQRKLTLNQVRKLSVRFKLPADVLIGKV